MRSANSISVSRLSEIVGDSHVLSDPTQSSAYEIGGASPAVVVSPGCPEEVAKIVKCAIEQKLTIIPCGARTKLGIGMPPRQYDIALDTRRLNRILAYDPGDLTLSIEAGVPLHEIQTLLAEHNQFLPLAVPFWDKTTAGGTIASDTDSPLRQSYGTARDYILGMEFVTGEGIIGKSGGRVVKNVSGYDLHKILIGSLGTLGVIARINLRTFPRPEQTRDIAVSFESAEKAIELRHQIMRSPLKPLSLEILGPGTAEILLNHPESKAGTNSFATMADSNRLWIVVAAFAGNEITIARYEREVREMSAQSNAVGVISLSQEESAEVHGLLREFIPIIMESSPATTIIKMSVLPARMNDAIAGLISAANEVAMPFAILARGVGIIYFALLPAQKSDSTLAPVSRAVKQAFAFCAQADANVTIPWCPAEWKTGLDVWGPCRSDISLMRAIKTIFDPHDIFSPGRFVGGI